MSDDCLEWLTEPCPYACHIAPSPVQGLSRAAGPTTVHHTKALPLGTRRIVRCCLRHVFKVVQGAGSDMQLKVCRLRNSSCSAASHVAMIQAEPAALSICLAASLSEGL